MSCDPQANSHRRMAFRLSCRCRAKLVTLTLAVAFATLGTSHLRAEELPAEMVGVWVEGDCTTSERVRLINDLGVVDVLSIGGRTHLQILTVAIR